MQAIVDEFYELILGGVLSTLKLICVGLMDLILNALGSQLNDVSSTVGTTPDSWNASISNMMESISDDVMVPLAGVVLSYVMCWELFHMILEKNNSGTEFSVDMLFKWFLKTFIAIELVVYAYDIVMAVFYLAQKAITKANTTMNQNLDLNITLGEWKNSLDGMKMNDLLALMIQLFAIYLCIVIAGAIVTLIVYGRMIEIYLHCSVAPFPLATFTNREFGNIGQNFLKSVIALALQGILIVICVAIYAVLVSQLGRTGDIVSDLKALVIYTVLLATTLFKTGNYAKSFMTTS